MGHESPRSEYHQSKSSTHNAQESGKEHPRSSVRLPSINVYQNQKPPRKQTRSVSDIYDTHQHDYMKFKQLDEAARLKKKKEAIIELSKRQREIVKHSAEYSAYKPLVKETPQPQKMTVAKSQVHINPGPLSYTPVPKSHVAPTEIQQKIQREKEHLKQVKQATTYAQMVRQVYKPKVSEKKHHELEAKISQLQTKPRQSNLIK